MTQRDWIEKDFYRELGVASGASQDEIKKAYRKLARELHPDANPGDAQAEARFKSVSEAYGVLSDEKKRSEYDETRVLFAGGGGGAGFPGGFPAVRAASPAAGRTFDMSDRSATPAVPAPAWATCSAGSSAVPAVVARGRRRPGASVARTSRASCGSTSRRPSGCRGADPALGARGRCQTCCRLRRAAGHRAAAVPDLLRTRPGQPQRGCVRVLRAVPGLPWYRPDHRRPVPRVRRRRRQHPHPLAHHPRPCGGGRRAADQARRPGRAGPRWRARR